MKNVLKVGNRSKNVHKKEEGNQVYLLILVNFNAAPDPVFSIQIRMGLCTQIHGRKNSPKVKQI
jgi:hypothetical protein